MKRAGLLYTTGRVFAGSRSTWTCQGNGHAANRNPRMSHSKLPNPWGLFLPKHSSAETFAAELPPGKFANHAFSDGFSEAEKTPNFFRQVACCFADLRKYRHRKKKMQTKMEVTLVSRCSLSASSTKKHSMKPTAIAPLNTSSTPTNIIGTFSRGKQLKNSMLSLAGFRVFQFTLPKFTSECAHEKLPAQPNRSPAKVSSSSPTHFSVG